MKPTLVLLPGMLCDHAYFQAQLPELQRIAEVSVASYPRVTTIAAMAQQVLREAPERFAVGGHSMGGRVAQEIVGCAPERVLGVGLFATDYRGFADDHERLREQARRQEWLELVDRQGFDRFAQQWAPPLVARRRQSDRALIEAIAQMARRMGREALDAHCLAGLSRVDYAWLLPRVSVPTLFITGSEDSFRSADLHHQMASLVPGATVTIIEGAGHMAAMEDPQAVNAAMIPWIRRLRAT